jgi:hypothetical protein
LIVFGFEFGFFPISKNRVGVGNGDIDTRPEFAPLILKLVSEPVPSTGNKITIKIK